MGSEMCIRDRAMKDYFDGNVTKDKALDNFYKAAIEKYPNLSK